MRTVPYHLAELAAGPAEATTVASYGVQVGRSVEIDLDTLATDHPDLAATITSYATTAEGPVTGAYLAVAVPLVSVRQTDNAAGRSDLVAELDALEASELGDVVAVLLGRDLDPDAVCVAGAPYQVSHEPSGADRASTTLVVAGRRPWSTHLGGAPSGREVARRFTLHTSHAAWRDRRSRRLVALDIHAIEVLPDPNHCD
jgi:hypothetical protein